MIIRHIGVHQILINGYLPMNGKCALPYSFSFGEYSDEKLISIYTANIQMFIYLIHQFIGFLSVINPGRETGGN